MIVKDHILNKYVFLENKNKNILFEEILQTKYNVNIHIPKMNQVELIKNNIKNVYNNNRK